jgi:hypothetical protein
MGFYSHPKVGFDAVELGDFGVVCPGKSCFFNIRLNWMHIPGVPRFFISLGCSF